MKENAAASNPDQTTIMEPLQQKEVELDKSENSSDSIPATADENSNSTTASESSHQDESTVVGANNENATSDTTTLDKPENSGHSMPDKSFTECISIVKLEEIFLRIKGPICHIVIFLNFL